MEAFESAAAKVLEPRNLTLTCKGLSYVNWDRGDDDFEFVAGDDKVCHVHSALAEFLSPKVARIRKTDPFCYTYTLKNSDLFDIFECVVSRLQSGQALRVEKSNLPALLRLSQELDNGELLSLLLGVFNPQSFTLDEAIILLKAGMDIGTAFSAQFRNFRNFIASHFYAIPDETLYDLDLETTQILLSTPSLKIVDEESLYEFVKARSEKDERFMSLFEFVYFEYLAVDQIKDFASFVTDHLIDNISAGIWARICGRLILENNLNKSPRDVVPGLKIVYDASNPLDGIIAHLTRQCGGNVQDKGVVSITSSTYSVGYVPYHATFSTNNTQNPWTEYNFNGRRVCPTSYSIRSTTDVPGSSHPKAWVFEASNDKRSWTVLDRRDNNDLNQASVTCNFSISPHPHESFQYVRIRLTGPNHQGTNRLTLSSLEIFGVLVE